MADGWVSCDTRAVKAALNDRSAKADRAAMYGIRESGRKVKQLARRKARVYQGGNAVSIRAVRKARKAGVNLRGEALGKGDMVEGEGQVVAGLLRDSISSSRRLDSFGGTYTLRVSPRGPRVRLYAKKIEMLDHFMSEALAETIPLIPGIHAAALDRVMHG